MTVVRPSYFSFGRNLVFHIVETGDSCDNTAADSC
jgi:hypothetical protein